ncbi:MAG: hypothetical protein LBG98_01675 [Puniceicoccales bacterium]|nr:hypothetical protein [Puniceicoccales bacterium]
MKAPALHFFLAQRRQGKYSQAQDSERTIPNNTGARHGITTTLYQYSISPVACLATNGNKRCH